ncbi:hypothetical protein BMS3Bbin02_00732 [bacterium BMS3Bbin02]|nr:hypothetical protein BMS3Bbin02_00732 [bacterium BMS3Bbin02]
MVSQAAVLGVEPDPEHTDRAGLAVQLPGKLLGLVPLVDVGCHFCSYKLPNDRAKHGVLFAVDR